VSARILSSSLVARVQAGQLHAVARLISRAEQGGPEVRPALAEIYRRAGRAHVIGITGVPGSGKSTLVGKLTGRMLACGRRVGIIAIDPSSPYSGGAILGDRIRMSEMAHDPRVFIRSMATHGATGGMAHTTLDAVDILDVAGFETIFVETVGVGQDEVHIAKAAHTTIVVSAPGLGDELQAMKAGLLEIADIHVVSKCDRSDANRTITDLEQMLMLGMASDGSNWAVEVVGTSSVAETGLDELVEAIERHRAYVARTPQGQPRGQAIAEFRLRKTAENLLLQRFADYFAREDGSSTGKLMRRESDPYSMAAALLERETLQNQ
jgi:LAO/AO transport system kinase